MTKEMPKFDFTEFIRELFKVAGIEITGELSISRRILGESLVRKIKISTLESFLVLTGDGQLIIEGTEIKIKGSDKVQPYSINYASFEATRTDGTWTILVHTDEEEIQPGDDLPTIQRRSIQLNTSALELVKLIGTIITFADKIRGYFG